MTEIKPPELKKTFWKYYWASVTVFAIGISIIATRPTDQEMKDRISTENLPIPIVGDMIVNNVVTVEDHLFYKKATVLGQPVAYGFCNMVFTK